jgi:alpha-glucosidase
MLSGPMDFTPGIFDFAYPQQFPQGHGGGDEWGLQEHMRPHSTLARQLAQYVVIYSPIQMAADLPENYLAKPDAFQFIKDVPTDWEQTIALDGAVGDFIVIARKEKAHRHYSGNDWYIGGITNEDARDVSIPLDFLQAGKTYEAQVYQDGKDVDWQNNPYAISIIKKAVKKGEHIKVKMASAGGFAIRLKML